MSFSEWKKYKLGDVSEIIGGGTPSTTKSEYWGDDIAWITPRDLSNYNDRYISKGERSISNIGLKNSSARILPKNTILLTSRAPIGYLAIAKNEISTNQGFKSFIADRSKVDYMFLYYLLKHNVERLKQLGTGTTFAEISATTIKAIEVFLPSIETQKNIADILSSLDEKIEINSKTNQTLEILAQTLFKEMCLSKDEELPKGWKEVKLNEIIKIKHGYAFKGEYFSDIETEDILVTPGNFKIGGGFNYNKFKYYNGNSPSDYILNENDLIVTMTDLSKDGDSLGYAAFVPKIKNKRLLHNQRIGKIDLKGNELIKYFLYFSLRETDYRNFVLGSATGTTVRHTSPDRICDYYVKIPTNILLLKFNEIVKPILVKINQNHKENEILTNLKETLLPKLMSGQIDINISNT